MIKSYVKHFESGDMEEHKTSQRHWIKDKGPIVETNIGFIESYLDPLKTKAEFEGFVSIVDKTKSILLSNLVSNGKKFIDYLPWPNEFECEEFKKPDFTSLEVVNFASSGIPIGINIPNYDDVRENDGFKNVDLGNAYGKLVKEKVQFVPDSIIDKYMIYHNISLFVIV